MDNVFKRAYLGDGVYWTFDGYQARITTENGISVTNTICLEPEVLLTVQQKIADIREYATQINSQHELANKER